MFAGPYISVSLTAATHPFYQLHLLLIGLWCCLPCTVSVAHSKTSFLRVALLHCSLFGGGIPFRFCYTTLHCRPYNVHCTSYIVHYIVRYIVHCTLYTAGHTMSTACATMYTAGPTFGVFVQLHCKTCTAWSPLRTSAALAGWLSLKEIEENPKLTIL